MAIPYRARQGLRKFFAAILVLVLFAILLLVCWILWLNRYVVYSGDGAKLDFDLSVNYAPGETPVEPDKLPVPEIHNKSEEEESGTTANEFTQFSGYYVTAAELTGDFEGTVSKLNKLPKGSTVMLQLKDVKGLTYYSSEVAAQSTSFDVTLVDALITELQSDGHYIIAQIPAFQEYYFIMENERERVPYGLARAGGNGSLWLDTTGSTPCYWLDPTSDGTMTYLIQMVTELRNLGFDEVVFSDFRFPDTDKVVFDGDKLSALAATAATLVKTCATDGFCISFTRLSSDLTLPEGRTRLYLQGVSAADAEAMAAQSSLSDTAVQLVFLTDSGDPRFDSYSTLRPLDTLE